VRLLDSPFFGPPQELIRPLFLWLLARGLGLAGGFTALHAQFEVLGFTRAFLSLQFLEHPSDDFLHNPGSLPHKNPSLSSYRPGVIFPFYHCTSHSLVIPTCLFLWHGMNVYPPPSPSPPRLSPLWHTALWVSPPPLLPYGDFFPPFYTIMSYVLADRAAL